MTFILTLVSEEATDCVGLECPPLIIEPVDEGAGAEHRAGYVPGLSRHLGQPVQGCAVYVLLADEDGWKTSGALFVYPEEDEEPAFLALPDDLRNGFHTLIESLLARSGSDRVLLVAEYNGSVTARDDESDVDVIGPLTIDEFWEQHDSHGIVEESIVIIRSQKYWHADGTA